MQGQGARKLRYEFQFEGGEEFPSADDVCIAAHMASRARCARVWLMTIAAVAAAGAASGGCTRATAVRPSWLVGRRPRLPGTIRHYLWTPLQGWSRAAGCMTPRGTAISRPSRRALPRAWLVPALTPWVAEAAERASRLVLGPAVGTREGLGWVHSCALLPIVALQQNARTNLPCAEAHASPTCQRVSTSRSFPAHA